MKILIDKEYENTLKKMANRTKKYDSVFAFDLGAALGCKLDEHNLRLWYATGYDTKQAVYSFKDIKRCEVHANGCLLLFRDRKFVFLPVTNDEDNDIDLLEICGSLECELDGLHFFVISRLSFLVDDNTGKRIRIGFSLSDSPVIVIIMSIVAIAMATFFVTMKNDFAFVERTECLAYTGTFEAYKQDHQDYIDLYFVDDEVLTVHHACGSDAFFDKLDALEKGERVAVLVNPNVDFVVEIKTDTQEVLNFGSAQKAMKNEAITFMWMGIVLYCGAAYLFVYGIYEFIKERKDVS